jgi:hypothetical protein
VPLQAGHITSTTSDFVGLIKRTSLRAANYQPITYMFPKLHNQLRGVTLNNKVKFKLVLIGWRTIENVRYGVRR